MNFWTAIVLFLVGCVLIALYAVLQRIMQRWLG